jgi:Iap family predicted aminopeptidase
MTKKYKELNQTIKNTAKQNIRDFELNLAKNSKENPKQVYKLIVKQLLKYQSKHSIEVKKFKMIRSLLSKLLFIRLSIETDLIHIVKEFNNSIINKIIPNKYYVNTISFLKIL